MRNIGLRGTLAAAALALLGAPMTGCARPVPAASVMGVVYTCCARDVSTATWHPGQRLRIAWIPEGRPVHGAAATTLTAVLIGPYRTVTALKAANDNGADQPHVVATAPVIRASGTRVGRPVSVITIPADAAPGYYALRFQAAAGNVTAYGATVISVG